MVNKGKRKNGQPIIISGDKIEKLTRIAIEEKIFSEAWLQGLIHNSANLLPVEEIETSFSPLISLGTEITTKAGSIDNLLISPEGYITIVETKLWRNSEARREVVGQIIDYAKELSKWTYDDLNKAIILNNQSRNKTPEGLLETLRKYESIEQAEEQYFIDNVNRNLKRGRFLLLIVGDGIKEGVEEMVEYINLNPQLQFTLALIELQVYKFEGEEKRLVIPQIITRTREITRAVVKIENKAVNDIVINVEAGDVTDTKPEKVSSRFKITADDFFLQLEQNTNKETMNFAQQIIADCEEEGYLIEWNTGSFGVKLADPEGSGVKISLFNVDRGGLVYLGFSREAFEKLGLSKDFSSRYAIDTAKLFPGLKPSKAKSHLWEKYQTLDSLKKVYQPFMQRVLSYTHEIAKARNTVDTTL